VDSQHSIAFHQIFPFLRVCSQKKEKYNYSDIIGNKTTKLWQQEKKKDVEGEGAVNERTVQRWLKWFASGNLSSEDEQRPERPQIWDSEATKETAEQQPSSTCRSSDTLGPSKSTIHCHLTALGKINKSCRIVPY
jgi:hypothetical protein